MSAGRTPLGARIRSPLGAFYRSPLGAFGGSTPAAGEAAQAGSYRFKAARFNVRQWGRTGGSSRYDHAINSDVTCICTFAEEGVQALMAGFLRDTLTGGWGLGATGNMWAASVRASSFTAFAQTDTWASHPGWSLTGAADTTHFVNDAGGPNAGYDLSGKEPDGATPDPGTSIAGDVLTVRTYLGTDYRIYDVATVAPAVGFVFGFVADSTNRLLLMARPHGSLLGGGTDQGYNSLRLDGYLEIDLEIL